MREAALDALPIFAQESHYYLTGIDSSGFVFFQCAVLTADEGAITLLTRRPDLEQARRTSVIEDLRIWYDAEGADPTREALAAMTEAALPGRPLGEIDDAHRRVFDKAGYGKVRLAACGYSLGATFKPSWMDVPPMIYAGNPPPVL